MESVDLNGARLEYEVVGSGEPLLLINNVLADSFLPLLSQALLADRHMLIRYHRRGWAGSTHTPPPVSIADHAADGGALLEHLRLGRVHVAGHSSSAAVAAQLALDHPQFVHTLIMLEPALLSVPSGHRFLEEARPVFDAYERGDRARAVAMFLAAVSGLDWTTCEAILDRCIPGAVGQAITDADTLFGIELPALTQWTFGTEEAARIRQPVLSVLGTETLPLFVDVAAFLRTSLPEVEDLVIDGVGHLLHIQRPEPVARGLAAFLEHNAIAPRSRATPISA